MPPDAAAADLPKRTGRKAASDLDAVIVGAGFSGLYMLYRLRQLGLSVRAFEAGSDIGGTWYWNRYPGARCDSESEYYCYSFSDELLQEWEWSERFPAQAEILRYLNYVADRLDLRRDIQVQTRVSAATFDEKSGRWMIRTDDGKTVATRFCVLAVGSLSSPNVPDIKGLDTFGGTRYHTSEWPHEGVDFTGKRVGVIGTGSSGVQSISVIAEQAAHLFVFQRTPAFVVPARNGPMDPQYRRQVKANYPEIWRRARQLPMGLPYWRDPRAALEVTPQERERLYESLWQEGGNAFLRKSFRDVTTSKQANDTVVEFVHRKTREIVRDPAVAEKLLPTDYPIGTKRICAGTNYYETFNRDNVTLADLRNSPIEAIIPGGLRTQAAQYQLDSLVLATGFDAMTGPILGIDIRGRSGTALAQKWAGGPSTYLGLMTAGFPNLFTVTGPHSPSVLCNMPPAIEQHVDWITGSIRWMHARRLQCIEATVQAEEAWVAHCNELAGKTLFPLADSWYMGANIPGKPHTFMVYVGGLGVYRQKCDEIAANGYEGFAFS